MAKKRGKEVKIQTDPKSDVELTWKIPIVEEKFIRRHTIKLDFWWFFEKSKLELKKVFNLLIITEVKLRKYLKSDEFGNWSSKAHNVATRVESPMSEKPTSRPGSPRPPSDPEMVDADQNAHLKPDDQVL